MSNSDQNHLWQARPEDSELDSSTLDARKHKAKLLFERAMESCLRRRAIVTATSSTDRSDSVTTRFANSMASDNSPLIANVGTLDVFREKSVEYEAKVQLLDDGGFDPGTILLPIPRTFVELDLPIEVRVMLFRDGNGSSEPRLEPLGIDVAEHYPWAGGGALLTLEPRYWDDPDLPPGYAEGRFVALASLGLVGTPRDPDVVIVVVACLMMPEEG